MPSAFDFAGHTVFVAGGTSGINLGIAQAFARAGASVGVLSRQPEKVHAAVQGLQGLGARVAGWSADVRDAAAIDQALTAFAKEFGPIDVLVSGAAGNFLAPARTLSPNGFKAVVDIDLLGTFNVARAAYSWLRKPGASIINLSAPQAYIPFENQVHACAAKAGVDQITRVLAKEWGPEGIRVNSISPGPIGDTEGLTRLARRQPAGPSTLGSVARTVPLRRLGTVEDIANVALFLASPLASYLSGAVVPVDGGWGVSGPTAPRADG